MLVFLPATAQSVVSERALRRVVGELAGDAMRGRSVGDGSVLAARYLEKQFQRAGLQPLPGAASFAQEFTVYQSRSQELTVSLNGQPIDHSHSVLLPGQPSFSWTATQARPPRLLVVPAGVPLRPYVDSVFKAQQDLLVLVHPDHSRWFNSLVAHYWSNSQYSLTPPDPFSVVLLLTTDTKATSFSVSGRTSVRPVQLRNVVGVLPGRDPAHRNEQVIFSAHYDHLGIRPAVQGDSIANGADDDASGTAAVVALARYYHKRHDNARTLVFVAFTAEEVGGFGAEYFSRQLQPRQVAAMLNIEMIGTPAKFGLRSAFVTGFEKSDLGAILQRNVPATAFRFEPDPYPDQYLFYRSDNYKLAQLGIPAHTISTVQLPSATYYHTVDDEIANLNFSNMRAVVQAIAAGAASLVSGQSTPTRLAPGTP
ncbi:M20/M25/M40 family metallo-hydrolase [Hymenobacter rigui]|uniref:M20/M25/M40 family metallo-hydrolase n=1 Tax=Hymenobacter rigui TaxID=334424 RepID=UPI001F0C12B7|nr:M20/M25/M40 family metallo-hydrolase [Hymenobacter rigui]